MTPLFDLNQQLLLSPYHHYHHHHHHASASFLSSGPTFFNTIHQDRRGSSDILDGESSYPHHHQIEKYKSNGRWSDHIPVSPSFQTVVDDNMKIKRLSPHKRENEDCNYGGHDDESKNRMPSKMMKSINNYSKIHHNKPVKFTLNFQDHQRLHSSHGSNGNDVIRVCSDCNTTTTPLWRSGPRGPKSLCNACGIRQRKARRAMAAAAAATVMGNVTVVATCTSSEKGKFQEKKARKNQSKKLGKSVEQPNRHKQSQKPRISLKNLALSLSKNCRVERVFPEDVEEAALLLMELSCGFLGSRRFS